MIALNIVFLLFLIGFLCWLVFTLAVYVLLLFFGVTTGMWAYETGAGMVGAVAIGANTVGAVFIIGQLVFALARPLWIRLSVALLFAGPAAVAGYAATHGIAKHFIPSETWQMIFSIVGAIAVGITALYRMAGAAPFGAGVEHAGG